MPPASEYRSGIWINSGQGLIICIGCCHAGIINTIKYIVELTGESRIHTIIGGFHLLCADEDRLTKTIAELKQFEINKIIPCHCTGDHAYSRLLAEFDCTKGYGGMEIQLPLD